MKEADFNQLNKDFTEAQEKANKAIKPNAKDLKVLDDARGSFIKAARLDYIKTRELQLSEAQNLSLPNAVDKKKYNTQQSQKEIDPEKLEKEVCDIARELLHRLPECTEAEVNNAKISIITKLPPSELKDYKNTSEVNQGFGKCSYNSKTFAVDYMEKQEKPKVQLLGGQYIMENFSFSDVHNPRYEAIHILSGKYEDNENNADNRRFPDVRDIMYFLNLEKDKIPEEMKVKGKKYYFPGSFFYNKYNTAHLFCLIWNGEDFELRSEALKGDLMNDDVIVLIASSKNK
ncbi:MAG: hypothetical protein V4439_00880 [Patescibacteria group bacterium]